MRGIVFICASDSTILERRCDTLDIPEGKRLLDLIPNGSRDQAERFLMTVRSKKAAFNWKFDLLTRSGKRLCYFAGVFDGDDIIVVGAESRAGVSQMYRDLIEINNEQTNQLRAVLKDQSIARRELQEEDRHLYEQLSRVNNELATLQRELYKKNVELAKLNEQKNHFLGIVAHDLRNPLSLIMGYADFLEQDLEGKLQDEQQDFLRVIQKSSSFMLSLVNDLLDVAKIEAGRLDLNLTNFDIAALVAECVALNTPMAARKQIQLLSQGSTSAVEITADKLKLSQVLNNILSNAVKFSPRGNSVDVTLVEQVTTIRISIADQGPGIDTAELSRLFQPFERGSSKPTEGEQSTGLGLAIVKKIIEGHGGELEVSSTSGNGSVFSVTLPRSPQPR
ncbi:MAG TPA: HAMP domain-containing sensor histidine kinase [Candidatus Kapabacteria bacterium]|nr:HAMP domain-containing sensor histidine kinase [Candidatus Kapabacteria bacterium]